MSNECHADAYGSEFPDVADDGGVALEEVVKGLQGEGSVLWLRHFV